MGRKKRAKPFELVDGWPEGVSDDPIGRIVQQFVLNLRDAMEGRSIRSVAAQVDMDHTALAAILAGKSWPDLVVIGTLERGLGRELWPAGVSLEELG